MSGTILATTEKSASHRWRRWGGAILQGRTRGKGFIQLFPSNVVMGSTSQANLLVVSWGLNQGGQSGGLQAGILLEEFFVMPFRWQADKTCL